MPNDRGIVVPGGASFFTVNLLDRRKKLLTANIDLLRAACPHGQSRHPSGTVAICILPDYCIRGGDGLDRHVDYIKWNPVKHGLVDAPDQ